MNAWRRALREGAVTGSAASIASALALMWRGRRETGRACAPLNAVSHWVWDRESLHADEPSARHTAVGYLVHHGASVFWGTLHARLWGRRDGAARPAPAVASAAAVSALACFVDYRLTPDRLTPGFEHRLSLRSMALVYACFGLGLAAATVAVRRAQRDDGRSREPS